MNMSTAVIRCLKKYADFSGTAVRSEFWWFYLFNVLVTVLLYFSPDVINFIGLVALLIPSLSSASRRLHDTGRSGWWQLLILIPFIGALVLIVFLAQKSKVTSIDA
jgi:uncharacterized membrane protein YhaH (DUF805 family)